MAEEPKEEKESTPQVDYTKPGKKKKGPGEEVTNDKNIVPVVSSDVVRVKRTTGRKIKDLIIAADLRTVANYVTYEVLIPAFKNMLFEGISRGAEKMVYRGEARFRPRHGGFFGTNPMPGTHSKVTYNISSREMEQYRPQATNPPGATAYPRQDHNDFLLASKQDAESVLEHMYNLLGQYESLSVAEVNELMNLPSVYTDQKWGWTDLRGVEARQVRGGGWIIDLPKPEPI